VYLQYFNTVGWVFCPVNRLPDNLYCVGGDVKTCSINQWPLWSHHFTFWISCTGCQYDNGSL